MLRPASELNYGRSGRYIFGLMTFGLRFFLLPGFLLRLVLHHKDGFLFLYALVSFFVHFIVVLTDFGECVGHVLLCKTEQKGVSENPCG